jgi:hypothetical protein
MIATFGAKKTEIEDCLAILYPIQGTARSGFDPAAVSDGRKRQNSLSRAPCNCNGCVTGRKSAVKVRPAK